MILAKMLMLVYWPMMKLRVFSLFWTDWSLSFLAHSLSYVTITFLLIMFTKTSDTRAASFSYRLRHRRGLISVSEHLGNQN